MNLQLLVDVAHVEGNRVHCDVEFKSGGFIVVAFHQQAQETQFMRCKETVGLSWRLHIAKQV